MLFFFLEIPNDSKVHVEERFAKLCKEKTTLLAQLAKEVEKQQNLILETGFQRMGDLIKEARSKFVYHHKFSRLS